VANKATIAETAEAVAIIVPNKFGKEQILSAKKYAERRDLLTVVLTSDRSYTLAEVDRLIDEFMKKGVK
jgi:hypothetical protein